MEGHALLARLDVQRCRDEWEAPFLSTSSADDAPCRSQGRRRDPTDVQALRYPRFGPLVQDFSRSAALLVFAINLPLGSQPVFQCLSMLPTASFIDARDIRERPT